MITIKDIENQLKATEQARLQLEKTKKENEDQAKEYRTQADAAAVAGDLTRYKELKALADDAEAVAYVCGKQLEAEQGEAVTKEQTQEAWADYAEQYGKKLAAKLKEFDKAKTEMLKLYAEAVDLQAEACATRERLAEYAGVRYSAGRDGRLDAEYPMGYISCDIATAGGQYCITMPGLGIEDKDAVYYLANDMEKRKVGTPCELLNRAKDSTANKVCQVVRLHRADK